MRSNFLRMAALCLIFMIGSGLAWGADTPDRRQGLFLAGKDGNSVPAPVLGATVEVRVTGVIARTKITQIFMNPGKEWLEGIYIFPLPGDAAVDTLQMKVGNRTIQGIIQDRNQARQTYEDAKQQGVKASLIEQQRPDIFTTAVANIGPGETVEVAIELQQVVRWELDRFSLRLPMVVSPRSERAKAGGDQLLLPPVRRRKAPRINPFALHADLDPGFPLARLASPSHAITVAKGKDFRYAVDLKKGMESADSDFVLEWAPAVGSEPRGAFYSEVVDGERYDLLMVLPPDAPGIAASRLARETVLILDTSGSMEGAKITQARAALLLALDKLRPTDTFNVVRFATATSSAFPSSVPASPAALEQARRFIGALNADGVTNMLPAFKIVLQSQVPAGRVRQVIFATDGELDDEKEVVEFVTAHVGGQRLFPIAIGPEPKAAFLRQLAALGRGSFTQITDTGKVGTEMATLFSQLDAPMLQRIEVQWNDSSAEAWPARTPDLYLGEPLVLTARSREAEGPVSVSGVRDGAAWQDSFPAAVKLKGAGIDKLWARRKIQGLMDSLDTGADQVEVRRAVVELGLRHHLITDYTSLVAVDEVATAPGGVEPVRKVIPVNPPPQPPGAGSVEDTITVTAESPLLDERRISTGATVTQGELAKIPTARDSWNTLAAVPGVLTDRINVGGNESGQQAVFVGPGSGGDQAVWAMDGTVVTDTAPLGTAPAYVDFEAFEEMIPTFPEAEAKSLCAEIARTGWAGITLEQALTAAPSQAEALRQAVDAGLLRGFLAVVLHDKGCSEPPADVLAEAQQYTSRFVRPKG
jgi:Ca-activated chloride channel family protein